MSPLFQLVLFNFLFRWLPLFGCTFYSTTGFIQLFIPMAALIWSHFLFNNWFYSTFYSNGRPYLVAPFIQQLVLFHNFNSCSPDGRPLIIFIQLFIPMAALIWSHFLFNFLFLFKLNGCPYLINFFFFFFFFFFSFGKKGVLPGIEPGTS